ncbi:MAG: OmpA family protein [Elusimicrobia bacterium]|jgi:outer membrane protein OmpA-like peptidoglycan-associated protein|nr:OmpA family protein [Elusimicrobiota bacterium]
MKFISRPFVLVLGLTFLPLISLHAKDVTDRWGWGGSLGMSDFLSSSSVRRQTKPGPAASAWVRYGVLSKSEFLFAFENVQANGKNELNMSRLRPLTANWLQSFGDGPWTPYVSVGGGPVWVRRAGNWEQDRLMTSLRAGSGLERQLGESLGLGLGLTYHHVFSDGRYARSSSALTLQFSANYFFWCGNTRLPVFKEKPAPKIPTSLPPTPDADGDGVPDKRDACPGTEQGVAVDVMGCPRDTDGDGVLDGQDECPGTPQGTLVNDVGCPAQKVSVTLDVKFESGKFDLSQEFDAQLLKCANFMKRFPSTTVVIEGHSDSVGSATKNKVLSQKRAEAVRSALISRLGVAAERVSAMGFGSESPVGDNNTAEGRAANRRVVATISALKK